MSSTPQLRLAIDNDSPVDTLPFERRAAHRRATHGQVTAVHCASLAPSPQHHNQICSLNLLNMSDFGVGALTQQPIPVGAAITIFFPPHGPDHGFDVYGHVVRCTRRDNLYEIGIALRTRAAA